LIFAVDSKEKDNPVASFFFTPFDGCVRYSVDQRSTIGLSD
jgi:hypothetical protein